MRGRDGQRARLPDPLNSEGLGSLEAAPVWLRLPDAVLDPGGGPVLHQPDGLCIQQAGASEDYQLSRHYRIINDAERILDVFHLF